MDVSGIIQTIAISLPPLLLALTLHELAHGYVALRFGDETARWAGRLTLNPIKHMDPLGTFFILFGMITRAPIIGWAKPVPVNPHNLRRPHTDMIWVALAGPAMNLALATFRPWRCGGFPARVVGRFAPGGRALAIPVSSCCIASLWINVGLAIFNLIADSTAGWFASAQWRIASPPCHDFQPAWTIWVHYLTGVIHERGDPTSDLAPHPRDPPVS